MATKRTGSNPPRIPEFRSIQEEADFWDTHDLTDYWHEFRPVRVRFGKNLLEEPKSLSEGMTVRLDPSTMKELRAQASAKGIGPSTLARVWLLEQLGQRKSTHRTASKSSRRKGTSPNRRGKPA